MATDGGAERSFRDHKFMVPERMVKKNEDMERWEKSQVLCKWLVRGYQIVLVCLVLHLLFVLMQAYSEFMGFVTIVNGAVRGRSMKEDVPCSPVSVCATVLYVGVACICNRAI